MENRTSMMGSQAKRRRTAPVSRLIQLLRAHGLIAQIPHAHRYRVSEKSQTIMNAAVYVRYKAFPQELQEVAELSLPDLCPRRAKDTKKDS
jgi:DNA-binding IclR family transcriptional regulator